MVSTNQYSLLRELARAAEEDSRKWFPDVAENKTVYMLVMALGLNGEAGEVGEIIKKISRGTADINDAKTKVELGMEIADVFTYLLAIAAIFDYDLEKLYYGKRRQNERRFGRDAG